MAASSAGCCRKSYKSGWALILRSTHSEAGAGHAVGATDTARAQETAIPVTTLLQHTFGYGFGDILGTGARAIADRSAIAIISRIADVNTGQAGGAADSVIQ